MRIDNLLRFEGSHVIETWGLKLTEYARRRGFSVVLSLVIGLLVPYNWLRLELSVKLQSFTATTEGSQQYAALKKREDKEITNFTPRSQEPGSETVFSGCVLYFLGVKTPQIDGFWLFTVE